MADERALRERARSMIQAGLLPNRHPDRVWGGPGAGGDCMVCRAPVQRDDNEFEIEFVRDGGEAGADIYHVHIQCFAAWELEANLEPRRARPKKAKPSLP